MAAGVVAFARRRKEAELVHRHHHRCSSDARMLEPELATNQPTNQPTNATNQPINQSISRSINQLSVKPIPALMSVKPIPASAVSSVSRSQRKG